MRIAFSGPRCAHAPERTLVGAAAGAVLLASAAALALPPVVARADVPIVRDATAVNLTEFSRGLSWSRRAANGLHRLVTFNTQPVPLLGPAPRPFDLPVPSSDSLFDPDLGPNRQGSAVVVYTRCAGVSGTRCNIYRFGVKERPVKGASTARCSEFAPSIWRDRVVFGRSGPRSCNGLYIVRPNGRLTRLDRRIPAETDVWRDRVAYLYVLAGRASRTVIRLRPLGAERSRVVVAGFTGNGENFRVTSPELIGSHIYWLQEDVRRDQFFVGRSRVHLRSVLQFSDRNLTGDVDSIAGGGRWYTNGRGVFQASPPLRFSARD